MWTRSIDPAEYWRFLRTLFGRITGGEPPQLLPLDQIHPCRDLIDGVDEEEEEAARLRMAEEMAAAAEAERLRRAEKAAIRSASSGTVWSELTIAASKTPSRLPQMAAMAPEADRAAGRKPPPILVPVVAESEGAEPDADEAAAEAARRKKKREEEDAKRLLRVRLRPKLDQPPAPLPTPIPEALATDMALSQLRSTPRLRHVPGHHKQWRWAEADGSRPASPRSPLSRPTSPAWSLGVPSAQPSPTVASRPGTSPHGDSSTIGGLPSHRTHIGTAAEPHAERASRPATSPHMLRPHPSGRFSAGGAEDLDASAWKSPPHSSRRLLPLRDGGSEVRDAQASATRAWPITPRSSVEQLGPWTSSADSTLEQVGEAQSARSFDAFGASLGQPPLPWGIAEGCDFPHEVTSEAVEQFELQCRQLLGFQQEATSEVTAEVVAAVKAGRSWDSASWVEAGASSPIAPWGAQGLGQAAVTPAVTPRVGPGHGPGAVGHPLSCEHAFSSTAEGPAASLPRYTPRPPTSPCVSSARPTSRAGAGPVSTFPMRPATHQGACSARDAGAWRPVPPSVRRSRSPPPPVPSVVATEVVLPRWMRTPERESNRAEIRAEAEPAQATTTTTRGAARRTPRSPHGSSASPPPTVDKARAGKAPRNAAAEVAQPPASQAPQRSARQGPLSTAASLHAPVYCSRIAAVSARFHTQARQASPGQKQAAQGASTFTAPLRAPSPPPASLSSGSQTSLCVPSDRHKLLAPGAIGQTLGHMLGQAPALSPSWAAIAELWHRSSAFEIRGRPRRGATSESQAAPMRSARLSPLPVRLWTPSAQAVSRAALGKADDDQTVDLASACSPHKGTADVDRHQHRSGSESSAARGDRLIREAASLAIERKVWIQLGRAPERQEIEPEIQAALHWQRKEQRKREQLNRLIFHVTQDRETAAGSSASKM